MAKRGGSHPEGLKQRSVKTLFLRAPFGDWSALMAGTKGEFRMPNMGASGAAYDGPTPVVLYALSPSRGERREGLAIVREHHTERLADIAGNLESLGREGFSDYRAFRHYWRERTRRPYRPLDLVEVFRVEPWREDARCELGSEMIERLYGHYMP